MAEQDDLLSKESWLISESSLKEWAWHFPVNPALREKERDVTFRGVTTSISWYDEVDILFPVNPALREKERDVTFRGVTTSISWYDEVDFLFTDVFNQLWAGELKMQEDRTNIRPARVVPDTTRSYPTSINPTQQRRRRKH